VLLDIATVLYGLTIVPLYDTLGPESIQYVIEHANLETIFCSTDPLTNLLKRAKELKGLKNIVALDEPVSDEHKRLAAEAGIRLYTWSECQKIGKERRHALANPRPSDCFSFSYTSGTTGNPKAVMISHANMLAAVAVLPYTDVKFYPDDVYISYLPLPHVFERIIEWSLLYSGSQICFYSGDILKLKDDLAFWQPTFFAGVPRLYNRFYSAIRAQFDQLQGFKKSLVDTALATKIENVKTTGEYTHSLYDKLVFDKTKAVLGGRVRTMVTGSAPIGTDVLETLKVVFQCAFIEGYGQTEGLGASFVGSKSDPVTGHVGGPVVAIEFKVIDVPEMNYLSTNKNAQGQETPQGEVCIRGPMVFAGYYKDDQKTSETIDKDGWLHSGDVGTILPSGALKITDRVKNIFKLAQGEYVAPEKVEQVYAKVTGVDGVYLHGDSLQYYTVAIVNPNKDYLLKIAKDKNIAGEYEQLCQNIELRKFLLQSINDTGRKSGLNGFESAKNIALVPKSFLDSGLLTATMKLQRHQARTLFKEQIAAIYAEGELLASKKAE
jgi:long-chain acyl-CoA synthetase